MKYRITYTQPAKLDLADITSHLVQVAGLHVATVISSEIISLIESLEQLPMRFQKHPDLGFARHSVPVHGYRIWYSVQPQTVQIDRITHQRQKTDPNIFKHT